MGEWQRRPEPSDPRRVSWPDLPLVRTSVFFLEEPWAALAALTYRVTPVVQAASFRRARGDQNQPVTHETRPGCVISSATLQARPCTRPLCLCQQTGADVGTDRTRLP